MDRLEMIAATYAAVGQTVTDLALRTLEAELRPYSEAQLAWALKRCRTELRCLALADIVARMPGDHPGAEEAWALVAKALNDERMSIAWTEPMRLAFGYAYNLASDPIAARMAFKQAYEKEVANARVIGQFPIWEPSYGHDESGRFAVEAEAARLNALTTGAKPELPAPTQGGLLR